MEKGKFSQPREYRDEERQIEEAFRQVTQKNNPPRRPVKSLRETAADTFPKPQEETLFISAEELIPENLRNLPLPEETIEDTISRQIEQEYPDAPAPTEPPAEDLLLEEEPEDFLPEEEYEEDEDSFLEKAFAFFSAHQKGVLAGLCAAALLMLIACIGIFAAGGSSKDEGTILNNVMVAGVNVGGMTKNEAIAAVKKAAGNTYTSQDMVVSIGGTEIKLSPKDTNASLDVKAAVEEAYQYGRTGTQAEQEKAHANALTGNHVVGLLPYLNLNKDYIRNTLNTYASDTGSTLTQPSYGLEGFYPSLSTLGFDPSSAQTLVLTMGTPGITFDVDTVYNQVLDAYSLHIFQVTVTDVQDTVPPEDVDLQSIYDEFYVKPVDDRMNLQTFETIPGSYGYEFDLEAAQKLVDNAQYGDVLRIPMKFIEPKLLEDEVLFRDILGEYQTSIQGDQNRITNIRLACQAINGTVLQPGDAFSFNSKVGEPTSGKGYQHSAAFVSGQQTEVLGAGISQAATTLYCSALLSDLEIVSRSAHEFAESFAEMGLDAQVTWGGADLKLRNNGNYPIQINASVSGSTVTVQILGTDERDYFIKLNHEVTNVHDPKTQYESFPHENAEGYLDGDVIQEGVTGYSVKSYKLKYSRSNGKLLSKDFEATTRYAARNRIVAQVAPPETTVPETTVPETTVPPVTTVPTEPVIPEPTVPVETVPETTVPFVNPGEPVIVETVPAIPAVEEIVEAA